MSKDPITLSAKQINSMSDNEEVLAAHPSDNVLGPPSDKPADFGMDLSGD